MANVASFMQPGLTRAILCSGNSAHFSATWLVCSVVPVSSVVVNSHLTSQTLRHMYPAPKQTCPEHVFWPTSGSYAMQKRSHLRMLHIHLGLICSSPPSTSFFPTGDPSADAPTGRQPPGHHVGPDFQTAAITVMAEGDPTKKSSAQGGCMKSTPFSLACHAQAQCQSAECPEQFQSSKISATPYRCCLRSETIRIT